MEALGKTDTDFAEAFVFVGIALDGVLVSN
jgi:hypothetical protein